MKEPLQVLLVSLAQVTASEINQAVFEYPGLSVIEALGRLLGAEREREILSAVAEAQKIPFIADDELCVEDDLPIVDRNALFALINAHKALPLSFQDYAGERVLRLAMANPLDRDAHQSFSALYGMSIRPCLARERAIKQSAARLTSLARSQDAKSASAAKRPQLDPAGSASAAKTDSERSGSRARVDEVEVRKAIQQVAATAIKHGAERVDVVLDAPAAQAEFFFEDGQRSNVDIAVSAHAFAGGLLRRAQITERGRRRFEGVCRIDFKSSSVNCAVEFERSAAGGQWNVMRLRDFAVEAPDDPNFWLAIPPDTSLAVRRLFREQDGVFVVVGSDESARMHAIQALLQSYPDCQLIEALREVGKSGLVGLDGADQRILISSSEADVLEALALAGQLPQSIRRCIKGFIAYYQLPRICEFCAEPAEPYGEWMAKLPGYIDVSTVEMRKGKGCDFCGGRGALGFVGVSSVVLCSVSLKQNLEQGAGADQLASALVQSRGRSILECGVSTAEFGSVPLDLVLNRLPLPPPAYEEARRSAAGGEGKEEPAELLPSADNARSESRTTEDAPVSGSAVFALRPQRQPRIERSRPSVLRHFEDESAEPKSIELVAPRTGSGPLLLVIDDDADQRAILRRVFELEGYSVEVAADGIDGIISANRLKPDLIIVDFMMPDLDGRETIRRLKKNPGTAAVPIIALTAYADPDVEYGLLKAGADEFCAKSVAKKVLLKRIEKLVPRSPDQR